jgi:hypothetical protein
MSTFTVVRRLMLGLALVIGVFGVVSGPTDVSAAPAAQIFLDECDPAYPDFCIPPVELAGDLNCADVSFSNFTVLDPDPHGFDTDLDGVGCESVSTAGTTEEAGLLAADCEPSYPDACLPAPPPDLNCGHLGFGLDVIHDPAIGATDPHGLDPDGNGRGCESFD